jgi:hypothetical protein
MMHCGPVMVERDVISNAEGFVGLGLSIYKWGPQSQEYI